MRITLPLKTTLPKTTTILLTALCMLSCIGLFAKTPAPPVISGFTYLGTYNGHEYYKSDNTYTWTDAKIMATNNGGYLASVTTQAENDWLYNIIKVPAIPALNPYITGTVWIGLTDAATEGTFVWDNGEPVCYINWDDGEPNNFDNDEDHVQMLPWNGKWNDWFNDPSLAIPFIMEIGAPKGPDVNVTQPSCTALGSIQVTSPAPAAGISYSIDGINYNNTTGNFINLGGGTYYVTAKTGNCTGVSTTVILNAVSVPATPTAGISQPNCTTPSGTITVQTPKGAGLTYTVSKSGYTSTNSTGIFAGLAPGIYAVTATLGTCTSSALSVTINAVPTGGALTASPSVLWPPNHKMVLVTITSSCGNAGCIVTGVSVNEEDNSIGDGNTVNDWQLVPGTNTVLLRAERKGPGIGRIYTVHTECGDVIVTVPHDQNGKKGSSAGNTAVTEASAFDVKVLNNPARNAFLLQLSTLSQDAITIKVMDINGRIVENRKLAAAAGTIQIGEKYRPGIYLVSVLQGNDSKQLKVVKQ